MDKAINNKMSRINTKEQAVICHGLLFIGMHIYYLLVGL